MSASQLPHPRHRLSEHLGNPIRLSLMAVLASSKEADFGTVRDTLGVSDSMLSRQTTKLEDAGLVKVRKGYVGKRPRTYLSLSSAGKKVWVAHVAALKEIVGGS